MLSFPLMTSLVLISVSITPSLCQDRPATDPNVRTRIAVGGCVKPSRRNDSSVDDNSRIMKGGCVGPRGKPPTDDNSSAELSIQGNAANGSERNGQEKETPVSFSNHKLVKVSATQISSHYKISPKSRNQYNAQARRQLVEFVTKAEDKIDTWSKGSDEVLFSVNGSNWEIVQNELRQFDQLISQVVNANLDQLIKQQMAPYQGKGQQDLIAQDSSQQPQQQMQATEDTFHKAYHRLNDITQFLQQISQKYSEIAKVKSIGKTFEGRDIQAVEITNGQSSGPAVVLECGIHAREWVSPASCLWVVDQLVRSRSGQPTDPKFQKFQAPKDLTFIIIPNTNPDGYVYTWSVDRMWRKNRAPTGKGMSLCKGTDLNRNMGHQWQASEGFGATCKEIYPGSRPFSEKETQSLRDYVNDVQKRYRKVIAYFAIHSFSQLWMYPYGYTKQHASNHDELTQIGRKVSQAIKSLYGMDYTTGPIAETIYEAFGSTTDYFYDKNKISLAFAIELRPGREAATTGFLLPPEQIIPTAQELWAGVATVVSSANNSNDRM